MDKGRKLEVERKFLLSKDSIPNLSGLRKCAMEQGYLSLDPEIRIRKTKDAEQETCFLTIKSEGDLVRDEFEIMISTDLYDRLSDCVSSQLIFKERYFSKLDYLSLEIDVYQGRHLGLIVAEIEFESETAAKSFLPPAWFGEEVTFNKRYRNKNLAFE